MSNNDFNEEDDEIILPDTFLGEILYVFYCLRDILKNKKRFQPSVVELQRQVHFFFKWMKIK